MGRKLAALCCLAGLLGIFCWLWFRSQGTQAPEAATFQEAERMDVAIQSCHGAEPVFAASLEDFIRCFNSLYQQDNDLDYFPDVGRWNSTSLSRGIHTPYPVRQFRFSEDEAVYSLPTVTVYTPMEDHRIQELTLNFDEHSYTEAGFQRFRQLCADTLRVFFADLSKQEASDLADRIIRFGNENVFESNAWYGDDAFPRGIYHRDGVGVYPYFAIGDWQRFCVIPVTQEQLKNFEEKGVILYEVE